MRQRSARQRSTYLPELVLSSQLKNRLTQGHPWVYADHVRDAADIRSGTWVRVRSGNWSAIGLWDARSPIAVRVFSQYHVPDKAWVRERIEIAWQLRQPLRASGNTTAYRWVYGESDGIPGVVVDLYGSYAVITTYAESLSVIVPWVVDALHVTAPLTGIVERVRTEEDDRTERIRLHWGSLPPKELIVQEHGLTFKANLFEGQKTGLFLDHRENRQYIRSWAQGREVLNCFAYTGAFSIYAAAGGAKHVVSCDVAAGAMADAQANWSLNGLRTEQHELVVEDCFDVLARYAQEGRSFDLIILDPPSFARSKQNMYAAVRAYTRLNTLALRCLRPGGLLATASCTSQVSHEAFRELLANAAAQAQRHMLILHDAGQPLDHPVAAHFPEGRYLKFILASVQIPG